MRPDPAAIRVVDLTPEREPAYLVCLEDWPGSELLDAGDHKAQWYARMRDRGLRVKVALDAHGRVGGMIQSLPLERSPALGRGLEFVLCIWVHAHRRGRGDFRSPSPRMPSPRAGRRAPGGAPSPWPARCS